MRALLAGCAFLVLGTAVADAQPYFGFAGPGYGYGHYYGWRRPHPRFYGGYGYGPRRCWWVHGYYGPRRVCRGW